MSCGIATSRGQVVSETLQLLLQNHRPAEVRSSLWRSSSLIPLCSSMASYSRLLRITSTWVLMLRIMSKNANTTTFLDNLFQYFTIFTKNSFLLIFKWHFMYFIYPHCFLTFHQEPLRRVCFSLHYSLYQVFIYINKIFHESSLLEVKQPFLI